MSPITRLGRNISRARHSFDFRLMTSGHSLRPGLSLVALCPLWKLVADRLPSEANLTNYGRLPPPVHGTSYVARNSIVLEVCMQQYTTRPCPVWGMWGHQSNITTGALTALKVLKFGTTAGARAARVGRVPGPNNRYRCRRRRRVRRVTSAGCVACTLGDCR